jgi:hypothetical protein
MRQIEMTSPDAELAAGDPSLRQPDGSLPFMQRIDAAEAGTEPPGAGVWVDEYVGNAPSGTTYRLLSGSFSQPWIGTMPTGGFKLQRWGPQVTPPPPAPTPALASVSVEPSSITVGGTARLTVNLSAAWKVGTVAVINLSLDAGLTGPTTLPIPPGTASGSATLTSTGATGTLRATAIFQGRSLPATVTVLPAPTPPPVPVPVPSPGPLPVQTIVNLSGKTLAQIQAAIDAAQPGTGLYFPAGVYMLQGTPRVSDGGLFDCVNKNGITIFGDGPQSVLDFGGKEGIWFRPSNLTGPDNCVRDLTIQNVNRGVCALDPQRLWVRRVAMTNVGVGYASERTLAFEGPGFQWLSVIEDCRITNWKGQGAMFHGGETLRRTVLQDDRQGGTYSHGLYIQAVNGLLVEDVTIEGVSGHAFQVYSDSGTHNFNDAKGVVMRRVTCRNCYEGPVIVANGVYSDFLFEDISVIGTVSHEIGTFVIAGVNDWINNLTIKNLTLDEGGDGLVLLSGATGGIRNLQVSGLVVRNHANGIFPCPPDWPNTRIEASRIQGYTSQNVAVPIRGTLPAGLVVG